MREYRDIYTAYGLKDGKPYKGYSTERLIDLHTHIRDMGFTTKFELQFKDEDETVKRKIVGYTKADNEDDKLPIFEDTMISIWPIVTFSKEMTSIGACKIRTYNPLYKYLDGRGNAYHIDSEHIQKNKNYRYFITNDKRVLKYNTNTHEITERVPDSGRVVIMGKNFRIDELESMAVEYKFWE